MGVDQIDIGKSDCARIGQHLSVFTNGGIHDLGNATNCVGRDNNHSLIGANEADRDGRRVRVAAGVLDRVAEAVVGRFVFSQIGELTIGVVGKASIRFDGDDGAALKRDCCNACARAHRLRANQRNVIDLEDLTVGGNFRDQPQLSSGGIACQRRQVIGKVDKTVADSNLLPAGASNEDLLPRAPFHVERVNRLIGTIIKAGLNHDKITRPAVRFKSLTTKNIRIQREREGLALKPGDVDFGEFQFPVTA